VQTRVGYAGGAEASPTYRRIGGHAESVRVVFDERILTLEELLTRVLRGAGSGRETGQYRSGIFLHSQEQAERIRRLVPSCAVPLAQPGSPQAVFWPAEDYHQKYRLRRNSGLVVALTEELGADWDEHVLATKLNAVGERGFDIKPWLEEMTPKIVKALR
jgi:peptide-methionine (S)-S-oxide reductase